MSSGGTPHSSRAVSAGMLVMFLIMCGKVASFARDAIMSACYGASSQTDAFFVANNVPNLVFSAFFASIGLVFLPVYNRLRHEKSLSDANAFASNALVVYVTVALGICGACLAFAPQVVRLMAPAFDEATHALATNLTQIVCCSFGFTSIVGILSSVQYAHHRYVGPQIITGINNVFTGVAILLFYRQAGIYAAAVAAVLAWVLQIPIQAWFLRGIFRFRFRMDLRDESLRRMSWLLLPVLASVSLDQVYVLTDNILGSQLSAGSISSLNYAQRLINVATGTFVMAITTVMYPLFSAYVIQKKSEALSCAIDRCIGAIVLVTVPVILVIAVFSRAIVSIAFQRGAFDEAATQLTASIFTCYAVGVVFGAIRDTFNRIHYAMQDTATPLMLSGGTVVVKVVLSLILVRRLDAAGLALATSLATALYCGTQFFILRRRLGPQFYARLPRLVGKAAAAAGAMVATIWACRIALAGQPAIPQFIAATALGLAVYAGMLFALKIDETRLVLQAVGRFVRRRA